MTSFNKGPVSVLEVSEKMQFIRRVSGCPSGIRVKLFCSCICVCIYIYIYIYIYICVCVCVYILSLQPSHILWLNFFCFEVMWSCITMNHISIPYIIQNPTRVRCGWPSPQVTSEAVWRCEPTPRYWSLLPGGALRTHCDITPGSHAVEPGPGRVQTCYWSDIGPKARNVRVIGPLPDVLLSSSSSAHESGIMAAKPLRVNRSLSVLTATTGRGRLCFVSISCLAGILL